MTKPCIHLIAGARPNFMKIAPIVRALQLDGRLDWSIIHTGQHYDREMNDVFFEELGIPAPAVRLGCGGGTHAEQTGRIMVAYEKLCISDRPAACLVVGDVNSTLACSIVAKKSGIPVAHVEAGLRSGDMSMPEEINRLVTDSISDWYFVTEPSGSRHLHREGKMPECIFDVGHVMVDNVLYQSDKLKTINPSELESNATKQKYNKYGVATFHRPSNVDDVDSLRRVGFILNEISEELPFIFAVHPRTRAKLDEYNIKLSSRVELLGPQPYMSFLHLWKDAVVVLTDSGGLQEETTALGVPCVTMRENTERPITVDEGSNILAGTNPENVIAATLNAIHGNGKRGKRPVLWDGDAAVRIVNILAGKLL